MPALLFIKFKNQKQQKQLKTQVIEMKDSKEIVILRSTKDIVAQQSESDHYFWLKIDFITINAYNVAFRFDKELVKILYLLPSALINEGEISFENDIHVINLPVPKYLDLTNYEKRIENNSIVLVFHKRYNYIETKFLY